MVVLNHLEGDIFGIEGGFFDFFSLVWLVIGVFFFNIF